MGDSLRLVFLIPRGQTEITASEGLERAFETCRQFGLEAEWIEEARLEDVLRVRKSSLPEIVVTDHLSNSVCYDQLVTLSQRRLVTMLGPQCLLTCVNANLAIPDTGHPVYSAALKGYIVTSTGVSQAPDKERLKWLVESMWGVWTDALHDGVTHMVAASVFTAKYRAAVAAELPILTTDWLEHLWSQASSDPHGGVVTNDKMLTVYKCPPLLGTKVCVTQLDRQARNLIQDSVIMGGGEYSGALDSGCNVLVCGRGYGDKWSAARRWGVPCVSTQWILDSLEKGHCQEPADYRVSEYTMPVTTSSHPKHPAVTNLNHSLVNNSSLNNSSVLNNSGLLNDSTLPILNSSVTEELELKEVKKSGTFLDGCKIHILGFSKDDEAHVSRVLKYAGALKMSQLIESVTHVIVNNKFQDPAQTKRDLEVRDLAPMIVNTGWIVESMRAGRPLTEAEIQEEEGVEMKGCGDSVVEETHVDKLQFQRSLLEQYK